MREVQGSARAARCSIDHHEERKACDSRYVPCLPDQDVQNRQSVDIKYLCGRRLNSLEHLETELNQRFYQYSDIFIVHEDCCLAGIWRGS